MQAIGQAVAATVIIRSMIIRKAVMHNVDGIQQLFYDTVTTINRKDYNEEQIAAWSAGRNNTDHWLNRLNTQYLL